MGTGGDRLSSGFGTRPCRCERKAAAADFFVANFPSLCLSRARLGKWHHLSCLHKKTERTKQNKTNTNKCRVLFSLQGGAVEWEGDGEAAARLRRYLPSHPDLVLESVREKRSISLCPLG